MRLFTKTLAGLTAAMCLFSCFISTSAITYITYGDFDYSVNGDGTYSVYSYNGESNSPELPESVFDSPVTGIYANCFKNSSITEINIPESYKTIGKSAFYGCTELRSVTLPSEIDTVGEMAFGGCEKLETADLSNSAITAVPYAMFSNCPSLVSVSLPNGLTSVDSYAFSNSGLGSVELPDSVITLGSYSFSGCTSLERVELPALLTEIPSYAFEGCTSLSAIVLPKGLQSIGDRAFSGCSSLGSVDMPFTLTEIGKYAFYNDTSLNSLFIPDSVTSIGTDAFSPMSTSKAIEISCYENSYAQSYCHDNYVVNTISEAKLTGDCNLDNAVNINDVTLIQKVCVDAEEFSGYRTENLADFNGDGKITIRDATAIQIWLVTEQ